MILSVVMAAYNADKYIREAIDSVLNQTYTDFEFIIINDGSTDSTLSILHSYSDERIKIIDQANVGLSKSLNKGISIANGEYIARMDADDRCHIDRFKKQLDYLFSNLDVVLLGSNSNVMDEEGNFLYTTNVLTKVEDAKTFLKFSPFIHSSVIFKKEIFNKCQGYPEDIIHHFEDLILWEKMFRYGKMANLSEALIFYRITPGSITNKTGKAFVLQKKISSIYLKGGDVGKEIYDRFIELTHLSKNQQIALYYNKLAKIYLLQHKNKKMALKNIKLSLANLPFNFSALKLLAYSIFVK